MKIKIKKIRDDAIIPNYTDENNVGLNIYSCKDCSLERFQRMIIPTGISIDIPKGYVGLIWGKSGLAIKNGLAILGGVIDSSYKGEYCVIALNTGYDDIIIKKGQIIAQLLIQPVVHAEIEETNINIE
jgi:dUTP pyrophosphatase